MSVHAAVMRLTVPKVRAAKGGTPLVALTAYTAPMAARLDPHADILLVGDSLGQVVHGFDTTLPVPLDLMILHTQAVMRTSRRALVVVDMPFGTYEESPEVAFRSAARVLKETGAQAVKLEGGVTMAPTIRFLASRGVPVMAHVGLLPQAVHTAGGYRTKGRRKAEWEPVLADAAAVAEAGAFCVVLEGVAEPLAAEITARIAIPTIGIGASAACDGQILVIDDLIGFTAASPGFARRYAEAGTIVDDAVAAYAADVRARRFPGPEHVYRMKE